MMGSPEHRERSKKFTLACIVENLAVLNGVKTQDEAVETLCEQFFPKLTDRERDAQPARMSGGAN